MMKHLIRCGAVMALLVGTSGCSLCFLPCYVCLDSSTPTVSADRPALPEVMPVLIADDVAIDNAQVPAR